MLNPDLPTLLAEPGIEPFGGEISSGIGPENAGFRWLRTTGWWFEAEVPTGAGCLAEAREGE
jgi:hypothetical protein